MNNNIKPIVSIELEPDNVELEKTSSVQINRLLRYGKLLESYMKNSQSDIQSLDISERVNNCVINKMNEFQSLLINRVDTGITTKLESVNSLMSAGLTNINLQINNNVKNSITDITSVLSKTEIITKKIQDLYTYNNNTIDKNSQHLIEFNKDVSKELSGIRSHINDIILKYNSRDNFVDLHQTIRSQIETLRLNIKDMINNNTTRELLSPITKDIESQITNLRVEMKSATERLNMENISSLIQSIIKSYFTELKLDLQNTNNLAKQIEGLNTEIKKISQNNMHLQNHFDSKLADIKENFNSAMNKTTVKGIIGENKVMNILNENLRGYEIKDTSGQGHQFDIHLFNDNYNFCIECKNHGQNVSTEDMKRFVYNVSKSVCQAVIIINHNHGFTNIKQDFVLTDKYGGKPVIFISRLANYPLILPAAIKMLEMIIDLSKKQTSESKQNNTSILEYKIEQQSATITHLEERQAKANLAIRKFTNSMIRQINDFTSTVLALL